MFLTIFLVSHWFKCISKRPESVYIDRQFSSKLIHKQTILLDNGQTFNLQLLMVFVRGSNKKVTRQVSLRATHGLQAVLSAVTCSKIQNNAQTLRFFGVYFPCSREYAEFCTLQHNLLSVEQTIGCIRAVLISIECRGTKTKAITINSQSLQTKTTQ